MKQDQECEHLCEIEISEKIYEEYIWLIDRSYYFTWYVDSLPSAYVTSEENEQKVKYQSGIPIGDYRLKHDENGTSSREYYIYNHHDITI